jgi:hypothetical protein
MVTEVLVWAMIVTSHGNRVVEIYDKEVLCRQEMREARRAIRGRGIEPTRTPYFSRYLTLGSLVAV